MRAKLLREKDILRMNNTLYEIKEVTKLVCGYIDKHTHKGYIKNPRREEGINILIVFSFIRSLLNACLERKPLIRIKGLYMELLKRIEQIKSEEMKKVIKKLDIEYIHKPYFLFRSMEVHTQNVPPFSDNEKDKQFLSLS